MTEGKRERYEANLAGGGGRIINKEISEKRDDDEQGKMKIQCSLQLQMENNLSSAQF
jgi:hypothetical protein